VNGAEVATPLALVTAVFTLRPPANVPVALIPGTTVNVTVTPPTGLPPASFTIACSGDAKAVLIAAVWGVPLPAAIVAGAVVVFASEKLVGVATPTTLAVTI